MNSVHLLTLLLVVVVAGVKADDKDLGEYCTSADTCVHPELLLVCDKVSSICVIQAGQSCNFAGFSNLCVSGAECSSLTGLCVCRASVYTAIEDGSCGVAAGKWGATCTSSSDCGTGLFCFTTNSQSSGVCECFSGKVADLSSGECVDISPQRIGHKCQGSSAATDCGPSGGSLQCNSRTGTCQCATGFTGPVGGTCATITGGLKGQICSSNADCGGVALTLCSSDNVCECPDDTHAVMAGVCYAKARTLLGGCTSCSATNNVCTGTTDINSCQCQVGLDLERNGIDRECTVADGKVGGACTEDDDCEDANASCSSLTNTCQCSLLDGFTGVDGGGCTSLFGGASTTVVPVTSLVMAVVFSFLAMA